MNGDDVKRLEDQFTHDVYAGVREAQRLGYNPGYFLQMVAQYGAVGAAKRLLQPPADVLPEGFARLWEMNRLDLTLENSALQPNFAPLFTDAEREVARIRLNRDKP